MFKNVVDNFMTIQDQRLFAQVPSAGHLTDDSTPLNEAYYKRHRIETVKRIWLTSQTDALALARMIDEDYDAARFWSKYVYQELNHDLLYLRDLEKHGCTRQHVASTPLFASTQSMVEYLTESIARHGSIPAVAYSVWVEWNSDKASAKVVERAADAFSERHVKGAHTHTLIDVNEDHYAIMLRIVEKLFQRGVDETIFYQTLYDLTDFFIDYFEELATNCLLEMHPG